MNIHTLSETVITGHKAFRYESWIPQTGVKKWWTVAPMSLYVTHVYVQACKYNAQRAPALPALPALTTGEKSVRSHSSLSRSCNVLHLLRSPKSAGNMVKDHDVEFPCVSSDRRRRYIQHVRRQMRQSYMWIIMKWSDVTWHWSHFHTYWRPLRPLRYTELQLQNNAVEQSICNLFCFPCLRCALIVHVLSRCERMKEASACPLLSLLHETSVCNDRHAQGTQDAVRVRSEATLKTLNTKDNDSPVHKNKVLHIAARRSHDQRQLLLVCAQQVEGTLTLAAIVYGQTKWVHFTETQTQHSATWSQIRRPWRRTGLPLRLKIKHATKLMIWYLRFISVPCPSQLASGNRYCIPGDLRRRRVCTGK